MCKHTSVLERLVRGRRSEVSGRTEVLGRRIHIDSYYFCNNGYRTVPYILQKFFYTVISLVYFRMHRSNYARRPLNTNLVQRWSRVFCIVEAMKQVSRSSRHINWASSIPQSRFPTETTQPTLIFVIYCINRFSKLCLQTFC